MYLLVGLGNPGLKYASTRHNAGFEFIEHFAGRHKVKFIQSPWQARQGEMIYRGKQVVLLTPETFMNLSGTAVQKVAEERSISAGQIIVVHDDLDLPVGRLKIIKNRGAGGHKGVASIIQHLNTNTFIRVRIGIGRPETDEPVEEFVLSTFSVDEEKALGAVFIDAEAAVSLIFEKGVEAAMNLFNSKKNLCSEEKE